MSVKAQAASDLSGKWRAVRYLDWGISDGKVIYSGPLILKPDHFAYFYLDPKQTLTSKIDGEIEETTPEGKRANESLKISVLKGSLQSDRPMLDKQCSKVPYLEGHFACGWALAPANFAVFRIFYSQLALNLENPWWDQGLGYFSIVSLGADSYLFIIVCGLSFAGREI